MRRTGMEQNRAAELGIRRAERFQGAGEGQDSYPGAAGHGMPGSLEAARGAEGLGHDGGWCHVEPTCLDRPCQVTSTTVYQRPLLAVYRQGGERGAYPASR